jgi:hypothetical protein
MRVLAPSLYQEDALASLNQRRHQRTRSAAFTNNKHIVLERDLLRCLFTLT